MKKDDVLVDEKFNKLVEYSSRSGKIDIRLYADYDVKRGLRDSGGKGVLTGLTEISDVVSFGYIDGERVPIDGELYFQGVNIQDLILKWQQNVQNVGAKKLYSSRATGMQRTWN